MKRKPRKEKRNSAKSILRLPDLEAAKSAVLNNLSCPDARRGYPNGIGMQCLLGSIARGQDDRTRDETNRQNFQRGLWFQVRFPVVLAVTHVV